jgi:ADP-heptose:LPS heptosyltransferase
MKILLIKRGAIGDILMTTPFLRQLKNNIPNAQVDYLTANSMASCINVNQYIDNIILLPDRTFLVTGLVKYISFLFSIRKKYDYIFILGKSTIINVITKIIVGSKLIGFNRGFLSRLFLYKYVNYNDVNRYQVFYYLDLLNTLENIVVDYSDKKMELLFSNNDIKYVDDILKEKDIDHYIVVTNSGGNNEFEHSGIRMLPNKKIIELLIKLTYQYDKIILLGGKIDVSNYNDYILQLPINIQKKVINFAGLFNIRQSIYFLSKAKYFYTTDCGTMHLGLISGIEKYMTCFFGPTNPNHILPVDTLAKIIWQDADIYDIKYQLYGKLNNKKYFQKLNIYEI